VDGPYGGETGPTPAGHGHGDTIKQSFCDPINWSHCNIGIRQVKLFTGKTLYVIKRLSLTPSVMLGILMK
jgi:hypothetical protein